MLKVTSTDYREASYASGTAMEIHAAPAAHPVDADGAAAGAANDQDVKGPAPSPPPPNDNANGDDAAAGGAEIAEQARGEKEAVPPEAGHPQATSAAPEAEPAAPAPGPDTEPAQPASNAADAEGASDAADPPQPASGAAGAEAPAAAGADAGAGDVGDEQVVSRLREQLATVDLTTTTGRVGTALHCFLTSQLHSLPLYTSCCQGCRARCRQQCLGCMLS